MQHHLPLPSEKVWDTRNPLALPQTTAALYGHNSSNHPGPRPERIDTGVSTSSLSVLPACVSGLSVGGEDENGLRISRESTTCGSSFNRDLELDCSIRSMSGNGAFCTSRYGNSKGSGSEFFRGLALREEVGSRDGGSAGRSTQDTQSST